MTEQLVDLAQLSAETTQSALYQCLAARSPVGRKLQSYFHVAAALAAVWVR